MGNWANSGGLCFKHISKVIRFDVHNGSNFVYAETIDIIQENTYYTIIGTHDGNNIKIYLNGTLSGIKSSSESKHPGGNILIGESNENSPNISLREVMLYDRALTEDEIMTITEGFERKYKKNTTN